jgi:hypothetical protein
MTAPAARYILARRTGLCLGCRKGLDASACRLADKAPVISQRFTVRVVPTLPLIDRGQVVARQLVAASVAALRDWLDRSLTEHTLKEARS